MLTIDQAKEAFALTNGISEVTHPYEGGSHDFRFESDGNGEHAVMLNLGGEDYRLDREALVSAVKKVPGGSDVLAERWPLEMLMEPLNWFFDHKNGDFKMLSLGSDVISFTKPSALIFDPNTVLDTMNDALRSFDSHDNGIAVSNLTHSIDRTSFTIRGHGQFVDARPGDRTIGGMAFNGSLLGLTKLDLSIFTERIECTNGMTSADGIARFSTGNDEEDADGTLHRLYEWIGATCESLYGRPGEPSEAMTREFERIAHLTNHVVEGHTADVLHDLFARLRLPAAVRAEIMDAHAEEGDGTMYGVVQAITRAAQHSPNLSAAQRRSLMRDAGLATMLSQELCQTCRRPVH